MLVTDPGPAPAWLTFEPCSGPVVLELDVLYCDVIVVERYDAPLSWTAPSLASAFANCGPIYPPAAAFLLTGDNVDLAANATHYAVEWTVTGRIGGQTGAFTLVAA